MKELQAYCTYFVAGKVLMMAYILHNLKYLTGSQNHAG